MIRLHDFNLTDLETLRAHLEALRNAGQLLSRNGLEPKFSISADCPVLILLPAITAGEGEAEDGAEEGADAEFDDWLADQDDQDGADPVLIEPELPDDALPDAPELVVDAPEAVVTPFIQHLIEAAEGLEFRPVNFSSAGPTGSKAVVELVVDAPEAVIDAPEAVADAPEAQPDAPEAQPDAPEAVADAPAPESVTGPAPWTEAEDAQAIEICAQMYLANANGREIDTALGSALGRSPNATNIRRRRFLLDRINARLADLRAAAATAELIAAAPVEATPEPQPDPQPAPIPEPLPAPAGIPGDALTKHLFALPTKGWSHEDDLELATLAYAGWSISEIRLHMKRVDKDLKDRRHLLTDGSRFKLVDVLARLQQMAG